MRRQLVTVVLLLAAARVGAVPSLFDKVAEGVWVVHDDQGQWGTMADGMGITHQNHAGYLAKKVLDLSDVPADVWEQAKEVRLSMYFLLRDYSWHDQAKANGLNESFQITVNGTLHELPTKDNGPVYSEHGEQPIEWYDFPLPKAELRRGPNEIVIGKAPSDKNDDYLYLGIDNSLRRQNSSVSFDGKTWTQERLTVPGGNGEYMVRLYLLSRALQAQARWEPGVQPALTDPDHLIDYAGCHDAKAATTGLALAPGQQARVEWSSLAFDRLAAITATVEATGNLRCAWLNAADVPVQPSDQKGSFAVSLAAKRPSSPSGLLLTATGPAVLNSVVLKGDLNYHPKPVPIDMSPAVDYRDEVPAAAPACTLTGTTAKLTNGRLDATFEGGAHLRLTSLIHRSLHTEMVPDASAVNLFLVEVDGKRYSGSRDFTLAGWKQAGTGFVADLRLAQPALAAELTAGIDAEGLRLRLKLTNTAARPVDFKLCFPHLAGLSLSKDPDDDYYYFPWGGGIIADTPAIIRRGYGDHEALYQVVDLFSPRAGGGLMLRADDAEGWHKVVALRKLVPGRGSVNAEKLYALEKPEYKWTKPLDEVPGLSVAFEYGRRTRAGGASYSPPPAVLAAHTGDWHQALAAYSAWAHRVWKFRPYPGRLKSIHNMMASGWGHDLLYKNGAYRTDFIKPNTDCTELMSWWDWSPLGPFGTPIDQMEKVLGPAKTKMWAPYIVKDPVTGKVMWNNQPGDYDGYNERFGGLPAFRKAVESYQKMGALVTLYTDPFRMDFTSKIGLAHGKEWCVVGRDDKLSLGYDVYNPCHDLLPVREWVATAMERVIRETGADGIRLDEYGHHGWACYNPAHQHTYAETGLTEWNKAVADATRRVREGFDRVRPDLVITTEHPGYDYLMQYLDGCITYDYTVQACDLRPLEVNTQRFYFRECKPYELDHRGADVKDRKKFWNGVESFGRFLPAPYYTIYQENEDVYQTGTAEPLVRAEARLVYANRFSGAGKTLYHLFNATGHTFDGEALRVWVNHGEHLFDLLAGREATVRAEAPQVTRQVLHASVYLPRGDVACLAVLPKVLGVQRAGQILTVTVAPTKAAAPLQLTVCDAQGKRLLESAAQVGDQRLDLGAVTDAGKPVCVKLLSGGQLVDAAELPRL